MPNVLQIIFCHLAIVLYRQRIYTAVDFARAIFLLPNETASSQTALRALVAPYLIIRRVSTVPQQMVSTNYRRKNKAEVALLIRSILHSVNIRI